MGLGKKVSYFKRITESSTSNLQEKKNFLWGKAGKLTKNQARTVGSLQNSIDANNQYERWDVLIISRRDITEIIGSKDSKNMFQKIFPTHLSYKVYVSYISIVHRLGKPTDNGSDKHYIIFKLCRHNFVGNIHQYCKEFQTSPFNNLPTYPNHLHLSEATFSMG